MLLTSVLLLVQLLVVFLFGIQGVDALLSTQAGVRLETLPAASDQNIQAFIGALRQSAIVSNVDYVTKEQAYQNQKTSNPDLVAFLDQYKLENPFPDTLVVTLKSLGDYGQLQQFAQQDQWRNVVNPSSLSAVTTQEQQIRELLQVTQAMRTVSIIFVAVAFAVLLFVVLELISRSVRAHSSELFLETMLGASTLAVLLPFMAEMTVLLLMGLVIATLLLVAFLLGLPFFIPVLADQLPFQTFSAAMRPLLLWNMPWILLVEVCLLPVVAYIGAFLGVGRKIASPVACLAESSSP